MIDFLIKTPAVFLLFAASMVFFMIQLRAYNELQQKFKE